jgi:hypothetical protein
MPLYKLEPIDAYSNYHNMQVLAEVNTSWHLLNGPSLEKYRISNASHC